MGSYLSVITLSVNGFNDSTKRQRVAECIEKTRPQYHWKDWCWSWNSNTLATWCKELTHWKRPWCWEGLGTGGEGDDRGWHGWMASTTRWTWVWVNSGNWWWTGKPGVLWFMGSQRAGHDWATELNWTELMGPDAMILVFWMLSFKPTFFTVLFHFQQEGFYFLFTFCHKGGVICISEVTDISPSNLDSSLCFFQPSVSHDVLYIEVK